MVNTPIQPWNYESSSTYYQKQAGDWATQAQQHAKNLLAPAQAGVEGQDPALAPHTPTIFDKPLISPSEADGIVQVPSWVKTAANNYVTRNGIAVPRQKGGGVLSHVADAIGDIASPVVSAAGAALFPILRLQNLENRYIAKPLAHGLYGTIHDIGNRFGAGLPDYNNLPGILQMSFETLTAPTTWLGPGLIKGAFRFAPELAASLPALRALGASPASEAGLKAVLTDLFIPGRRQIAQTVAGAFGGSIGAELAAKHGISPLVGGLVGGALGAEGATRLTRTPVERLGGLDRAKVRAHISSQEPPPGRGTVEYYMRMTPEELQAAAKDLDQFASSLPRTADQTSGDLLEQQNSLYARPEPGNRSQPLDGSQPVQAIHSGYTDYANFQEALHYRGRGNASILKDMDAIKKEYYDASDAGDLHAALVAQSELRRLLIEADRRGLTGDQPRGGGRRAGIQSDSNANWDDYRKIARGANPQTVEGYIRMTDEEFKAAHEATANSAVRNMVGKDKVTGGLAEQLANDPNAVGGRATYGGDRFSGAEADPISDQQGASEYYQVHSTDIDLHNIAEAGSYREMKADRIPGEIERVKRSYYDASDMNDLPATLNAQTDLRRLMLEAQRRGLISSEESLPGNRIVAKSNTSGPMVYHGTDANFNGVPSTAKNGEIWVSQNQDSAKSYGSNLHTYHLSDMSGIVPDTQKIGARFAKMLNEAFPPGHTARVSANDTWQVAYSTAVSRYGTEALRQKLVRAGVHGILFDNEDAVLFTSKVLSMSSKGAGIEASAIKDAQRILNTSPGKGTVNRDLMDSIIIQKSKRGIPLSAEELAHVDSTDMLKRLGGSSGQKSSIMRYEEPPLDPRTAEILGIDTPQAGIPKNDFYQKLQGIDLGDVKSETINGYQIRKMEGARVNGYYEISKDGKIISTNSPAGEVERLVNPSTFGGRKGMPQAIEAALKDVTPDHNINFGGDYTVDITNGQYVARSALTGEGLFRGKLEDVRDYLLKNSAEPGEKYTQNVQPPQSDAMRQALSGEPLPSASNAPLENYLSEVQSLKPGLSVGFQNGAEVKLVDAGPDAGKYHITEANGSEYVVDTPGAAASIAHASGPFSGFIDINQHILESEYAKMSLADLQVEKQRLVHQVSDWQKQIDNGLTATGVNDPRVIQTNAYNSLRQVETWIQQKSGLNPPQLRGVKSLRGPELFSDVPSEGPGTTTATKLSLILDNLNQLYRAGSSIFNMQDPWSAIVEARNRAGMTVKGREAFAQHLPDVISQVARQLGVRLSDSDANLVIDQFGRMNQMGQNFANAASTTSHLAINKVFNLTEDGHVEGLQSLVRTRYKGRFIKAPDPRPIFAQLVHDQHLYNLSHDQQAALAAATAPIDEVRDLMSAFMIKNVPNAPAGRFWPVVADPLNPSHIFDTRESAVKYIGDSFKQMSNSWLRESLKDLGTSVTDERRGGNLPQPGIHGRDSMIAINNLFRPLMAAGDISFSGVQGLLSFFTSPQLWGDAMHSALSGQHNVEFIQRMADKGTLRSFIEAGGIFKARNDLGEFGFRSAFEKLPGPAGKFFQWSNTTYNDFGNAIRLLHYDAGLPLATDITAQRALARYATLMSGVAANAPTHLENIMEFAPSYFRSTLGLLSDAVTRGSIDGQLARQTLTKLILGSAITTYGINKMLGESTNFDPTAKDFLRIKALGKSVSLFGPYDGLLKAMNYSIHAPDASGNVFTPGAGIGYLARSKASPVVSKLFDVITGSTWTGDPINLTTTHGILTSILSEAQNTVVPIAASQTAQDISKHGFGPSTIGQVAINAVGIKASDLSLAQKRDNIAQSEKGKSWSNLSPSEKFQLEELRPDELTPVSTSRTSKAYAERSAISKRYASLQAEVDNQFPAGKAWRDAHSNLLQQQAGAYDQWAADHSDIALRDQNTKASTPEQQALNSYYQLFAQAHQEGWDPNEISQKMDLLQGGWSPSQHQYVIDNTGLHNTPTVKAYQAAQRLTRPYWQIEDQVWQRLSDRPEAQGAKDFHTWVLDRVASMREQNIPDGRITQEINRLPLVRMYNTSVDQLHTRYRLAHPDVEAQLEKWWGMTTLRRKAG